MRIRNSPGSRGRWAALAGLLATALSLAPALGLASFFDLAAADHAGAIEVPPLPAEADHLEVSLDGEIWATAITVPLFPPEFRFAPGATLEVGLWVRNRSDDPAVVRLELVGSSLDALWRTLETTVELEGLDGLDGLDGPTAAFLSTAGGGTAVLSASAPIRGREILKAALRFTMPADATNELQRAATSPAVYLSLSEEPPQASPAQLPDTGAPPWLAVILSAALLLSGAFALTLTTKRAVAARLVAAAAEAHQNVRRERYGAERHPRVGRRCIGSAAGRRAVPAVERPPGEAG